MQFFKRNPVFFTVLTVLLFIAAYNYGQGRYTENMDYRGKQIGIATTDSIGFWGAAPTTQKFVTVTSVGASLTNLLNELVRVGIVKTN